MSFTLFADWDHLQDRTHANEIIAAYSERRQSIGHSAVTPLASGDKAQDSAYWKAIQQWIETYASSFVAHTETIISPITMWTFSTLVAATEMNSSGWRRATAYDSSADDWTDVDDAMYSTGQITSGDIRGPWIFDDLQMALDMLRWTKPTVSFTGRVRAQAGNDSNPADQDEANATQAVNWPLASWDSYLGGPIFAAYSVVGPMLGYSYFAYAQAIRSGLSVTVPTANACTLDIYAKATTRSGTTFRDLQSFGVVENEFFIVVSFPLSSVAARTSSVLDITANPIDTAGTLSTEYSIDLQQAYLTSVAKWSFTHTL